MSEIAFIPAFADNYIYHYRNGPALWLVDPGDGAPVIRFQEERGARPTAILCTHHHADHVGGVEALVGRYGVPVYGSPGRIPCLTRPIGEGDHLIDGQSLRVLAVPGHTRDHLAYLVEDNLFCGDTLFAAGCGRLFEGGPEQMWHSLQKLAALPPAVKVYCAHEYTLSNLRFAAAVEPDNPVIDDRRREAETRRAKGEPTLPSTIAQELASNPFLRVREPAVIAAARRREPGCGTDPVSVFAVLRRWKDVFQA